MVILVLLIAGGIGIKNYEFIEVSKEDYVTVGTPISPSKIEEKLNPVKTINGVKPDENGNVQLPSYNEIMNVLNRLEKRITAIEEILDITDTTVTHIVDVSGFYLKTADELYLAVQNV